MVLQLLCCNVITAQQSVKDFLGTWQGERNDTIFTIKLSEDEVMYDGEIIVVYGGYSVYIKNIGLTDDFLDCKMK